MLWEDKQEFELPHEIKQILLPYGSINSLTPLKS
jgi:hypothetical protein